MLVYSKFLIIISCIIAMLNRLLSRSNQIPIVQLKVLLLGVQVYWIIVTTLTVTQATILQGPLSPVIQLRDKMLSST